MKSSTPICIVALFLIAGCQHDTPRAQTREAQTGDVENAQLAKARGGTTRQSQVGRVEPFALFHGPMPTGVAVSHDGRVFVNFPRWGDPVEYTVAEVKGGKAFPYPDLTANKLDPDRAADTLVSVQSVVVDPKNRLWILDTGSINFGPAKPGGPKLWGVDLKTNQVFKRISFPSEVALPTTYLNDVRFDYSRGEDGMAFITDSSDKGPNGIIVVDLKTGESWRRLDDHPSTKADDKFIPVVEGEPLMARPPGNQPEAYLKIGADGIAVAGDRLFYCPLASRKLSSVPLDVLADRNADPERVADAVRDEGTRDFASDGLLADEQSRLYLTDYEHNAIHRRTRDGRYETIARDPRMVWPDSMALGADGFLYFTANQLNRQARFHNGVDQRQQPYVVFRVLVDAKPRMASR